MLKVSLKVLTTRTRGNVFFRQGILQNLESVAKTDKAFSVSNDRPYPIAEIVRRMVRIKRKCLNAIAHGDDAEHTLLRGEYKYFTGKAIDVRGASVPDLIAFVQCCAFFKFFDTNALDRVFEELTLRTSTLQPLEILALMSAVSDLPSKAEGNVSLDEVRNSYDIADEIYEDVRDVAKEMAPAINREVSPASEPSPKKKNPFLMFKKDVGMLAGGVMSGPNAQREPELEITNNKNFTDFRFRKMAVGSMIAPARRTAATEGSDSAAQREAETAALRTHAEHTYHQTLSATFFRELCDQALIFMGTTTTDNNPEGSSCQYSVEEQLEMLATLPEEANQELVMALLDALVAPLIHYDYYAKCAESVSKGEMDSADAPEVTPMVEQGEALIELYTSMPWHAVTVLKGLLLVRLEAAEVLAEAEAAMERSFETFSREELSGQENFDSTSPKRRLSKRAEFRQAKAREAMAERKQRNSSNAVFISRATEVLGSVVAETASRPFDEEERPVIQTESHGASDGVEEEDELLTFGHQCSEAIPVSDKRKLIKDFSEQYQTTRGVAGGQGVGVMGASQRRLHRRTHMLTPWEIASVSATLAHLFGTTAPIVSDSVSSELSFSAAASGLPFHFSRALQQAFILQLPQTDVSSLALMFSTCRPMSIGQLGNPTDLGDDEVFLTTQRQFFTFLRLVEERVLYHATKFSMPEMVDVLGAYMMSYASLGEVHNGLCEELAESGGTGSTVYQIKKEIGVAKTRLKSCGDVLEELFSVTLLYFQNVSSNCFGDASRSLELLISLSLNVFNERIGRELVDTSFKKSNLDAGLVASLSVVPPLSTKELWFQRFPQLQNLIHSLGASVVFESRSYCVAECITFLQVAVRMGDKMLDAAVTSVLERLGRLIELEDYSMFGSESSLSLGATGLGVGDSLPNLISLASVEHAEKQQKHRSENIIQTAGLGVDLQRKVAGEVERRSMQRSAALPHTDSDSALLLKTGGAGAFAITAQIKERLSYAVSVAARNRAEELFSVLEELCSFTHRRVAEGKRSALHQDLLARGELEAAAHALAHFDGVIGSKSSMERVALEGLRGKQVEYIERVLLPALRKATLATD